MMYDGYLQIDEHGYHDETHPVPSHEHDGYWSGF